jgi:hypothetical protein
MVVCPSLTLYRQYKDENDSSNPSPDKKTPEEVFFPIGTILWYPKLYQYSKNQRDARFIQFIKN